MLPVCMFCRHIFIPSTDISGICQFGLFHPQRRLPLCNAVVWFGNFWAVSYPPFLQWNLKILKFWCNEIIIGERWNYFAVQTYFAKITQRDKNRSQLNIESSPLVLCVHFVIHIPPSSNRFQKNVFVFLINLSWCPFCQICNFPDRSTPPSTSASWLRDLPDEDDPFLRRSP